LKQRRNMYETEWRRGSPSAGRLIADLESEFDLLRLERYVADLERRDERLAEEIYALRARLEPPSSRGLVRRWWRALKTEGKVLWLKARREMLAEEWRRCSAIAGDIRFGMRLTGARSSRA
jgi:hypothetical protein